MSPFDITKAIYSKEKLDWKEIASDYNPFIINRALSFDKRSLFHVNEMNKYHFLPKEWQYGFYFNGIPKGRSGKWIKSDSDSKLPNIQEYFQCSLIKAKELLPLINDQQYQKIMQSLSGGGR